MGGPNDSTSSSKGLGRKNPAAEQKWHPGRVLCYTWKKEHTYLAEQVEHNSIIYNTQFDLGIEHCTMEKRAEAMSLRPSMSKGKPWHLSRHRQPLSLHTANSSFSSFARLHAADV